MELTKSSIDNPHGSVQQVLQVQTVSQFLEAVKNKPNLLQDVTQVSFQPMRAVNKDECKTVREWVVNKLPPSIPFDLDQLMQDETNSFFLIASVLPNLDSVSVGDFAGWTNKDHKAWDGIAEDISNGNRRFFPKLQSIELNTLMSLHEFSPMLMLPLLKRLQLSGVQCESDTTDGKPRSYSWPYGDHDSSIEELLCYTATAPIDSIVKLLKHAPFLKRFLWEDHRNYRSSQSNNWNAADFFAAIAKSHSDKDGAAIANAASRKRYTLHHCTDYGLQTPVQPHSP